MFQTKSIGRLLKKHLDEPVRSGERALVLVSREDKHAEQRVYHVSVIAASSRPAGFAGFAG